MLILSRKKNEEIVIDDSIVVRVVDLGGGRVRIGVEAPKDVSIHRGELCRQRRLGPPVAETGDVHNDRDDLTVNRSPLSAQRLR